jgi:predicted transcriptional regulator
MDKPISNAEFQIMDVLWAEHPLAASDVAARVKSKTRWSQRTVKTLLSRLVDKGALAHRAEGRRYLYRPLLSREEYVQDATETLADKLFNGRAAPFVAHLADGRGLAADDIEELESLIAELKRDRQ